MNRNPVPNPFPRLPRQPPPFPLTFCPRSSARSLGGRRPHTAPPLSRSWLDGHFVPQVFAALIARNDNGIQTGWLVLGFDPSRIFNRPSDGLLTICSEGVVSLSQFVFYFHYCIFYVLRLTPCTARSRFRYGFLRPFGGNIRWLRGCRQGQPMHAKLQPPLRAPTALFLSLPVTGCMGWRAACSRPVEPGHCRSRTLRRQQRRDLRCHCRHVQGRLLNHRGRARQICASCAFCCPHMMLLLVVERVLFRMYGMVLPVVWPQAWSSPSRRNAEWSEPALACATRLSAPSQNTMITHLQ